MIDITNSQLPAAPGGENNEPGDTRATILLNPSGTKNYLKNAKSYVYEMSKEITKALSIEEGRIFIPYNKYQYERNTREDQILLRIDFKDTRTPDQPSSFALRYSLDKFITSAIPIGSLTEDLDSNYGAPENLHLWHNYRYTLIGVMIGLFSLIIIWAFAKKKNQEGNNFSTIIFYPLILVDFVLDIVILGVHGRDLKWFYICGFVFLLVPILFKIIITWFILENVTNDSQNVKDWREKHSGTALTFMFLSWIDLEALNVITSHCAGNEALNASFTEEGRKRVDRSIVFMTFIEDIPQIIIYALYQRYTVIPAIIPVLVLSSACIVFLFKIHDREVLIHRTRSDTHTTINNVFNFFNFFNIKNYIGQKRAQTEGTFCDTHANVPNFNNNFQTDLKMGDKPRAITTNTMEGTFNSKLAGKALSSGASTAGRGVTTPVYNSDYVIEIETGSTGEGGSKSVNRTPTKPKK
ncbi:hypothetical protein RclHR1_00980010 [Rhizophagus clarus]|uniref:Uncharacterized protein n=1 Tax=Rhizophagus clarus TaxID=94130 RepID=A0A2Z6SBD9_9GLOM|nr:hypothetical protein RclHR1_00980010 [Rhizophagus clarus]